MLDPRPHPLRPKISFQTNSSLGFRRCLPTYYKSYAKISASPPPSRSTAVRKRCGGRRQTRYLVSSSPPTTVTSRMYSFRQQKMCAKDSKRFRRMTIARTCHTLSLLIRAHNRSAGLSTSLLLHSQAYSHHHSRALVSSRVTLPS